MSDVFLGRQPIFDCAHSVRGYEILFRRGDVATAGVVDGDGATATVVLNTLVEIGLEQVVGDRLAWFNMTRRFLLDGSYRSLPNDRVVLEVLEDIEPTRDNIEAVRRAKSLGYKIALDDFLFREELVPFVEIADFIKVETPKIPAVDLARETDRLRKWNARLLAEKVETHEMLEACRNAGFDLFQGYVFCRPDVLRKKTLAADRASLLQLLSRIQNPNISFDEAQRLIERNLPLSYRILKLVNSGLYSLPRRVDSIRQAVVLLGLVQVRRLTSLVFVASFDDKPHELIVTALVRGRMCQLLGASLGAAHDEIFFTVGLLSLLDALLDSPIEELVQRIALSDDLVDALVRHRGDPGAALLCVLDCERGTWSSESIARFGADTIRTSWLEALKWASQATAEIENSREEEAPATSLKSNPAHRR